MDKKPRTTGASGLVTSTKEVPSEQQAMAYSFPLASVHPLQTATKKCLHLTTKAEKKILHQEQQIKTLEDTQIQNSDKIDALEQKLSQAKHNYSELSRENRELESRAVQESAKVSHEIYELKDIIKSYL